MRYSALTLSALAGTGAVTVLTGYFLFVRKRAKKPAKKVRQHQLNFHCSPDRGAKGSPPGIINNGVSITRRRSPSPLHGSPPSPLRPGNGRVAYYGRQACGDNPACSSSDSSLEDDISTEGNVSTTTISSVLSNMEESTELESPTDLDSESSTNVDITHLPNTELSTEQFNDYLNSPIVNSFADDTRMRSRQNTLRVYATGIVAEYDDPRTTANVVTETYTRIYETYHNIVPSLEPNTKPMFFNADNGPG